MRKSFLLGAAAIAAFGVASTLASPASANGRFPQSNAFFFSDADPNLVLMRVTFGLLVSHDRGASWDWICEPSIGTSGNEDPMWAVTPNGTWMATTFDGLTVTHDNGCSFAYAPAPLGKQVFEDLAQRPNDHKSVVTFVTAYDASQSDGGSIRFRSVLYETMDEGQTFAQIGDPLDPTLLGDTVDVAATDPERVYVSAVRHPGNSPQAVVLTSKDHGKTYTETEIPLVGEESESYIAAVDPTNADRLYVRTLTGVDLPGRLFVSEDGGKTFKLIFTGRGGLLGFALSSDGSKVYVGGPKDGVSVASSSDFAFTRKTPSEVVSSGPCPADNSDINCPAGNIQAKCKNGATDIGTTDALNAGTMCQLDVECLASSTDGLWACSTERGGFVAGLSSDDGATFAAKLHFCDIRGPLGCGNGSSTQVHCPLVGPKVQDPTNPTAGWDVQRDTLGCSFTSDAGTSGDGGPSDTDGGGSSSSSGGDDGSCSCRVTPASPYAAMLGLGGAAVGVIVAFARRRTRR